MRDLNKEQILLAREGEILARQQAGKPTSIDCGGHFKAGTQKERDVTLFRI